MIHIDEASFAANPNIASAQHALLLSIFNFRFVNILRIASEYRNKRFVPHKRQPADQQTQQDQRAGDALYRYSARSKCDDFMRPRQRAKAEQRGKERGKPDHPGYEKRCFIEEISRDGPRAGAGFQQAADPVEKIGGDVKRSDHRQGDKKNAEKPSRQVKVDDASKGKDLESEFSCHGGSQLRALALSICAIRPAEAAVFSMTLGKKSGDSRSACLKK